MREPRAGVLNVLIRTASLCLAALILTGVAAAQTATPPTKLERELDKVEFGLQGIGQFNSKSTGTVVENSATDAGDSITLSPSNTFAGIADIRYTAKPWFGLAFNYTYARYTETLTNNTNPSIVPQNNPGFIQTGVDEMSFGYVVTPHTSFFGLQPVIQAGAGSTRFRPTRGGGQGSPTQWRATYFYSVGLEKEVIDHFGVRVAYRQAFFKAPDFLLNYLTINKPTSTIEPVIGVYARF